MSHPAKFSSVIRILPAAGLVVLLTAPTGCAGDGIRGMLPWGAKKDYQPLETRQAADSATDEKPQEGTSETARPATKTASQAASSAPAAKRSSWSPFGRTTRNREGTEAANTAEAAPKPGLFRNPFRRPAAAPADPFVENAGADAAQEMDEEFKEDNAPTEPVKKNAAPTARATGQRQPIAGAGKVQRLSGGRTASQPPSNSTAASEDAADIDFTSAESGDADAAADALLKRMETGALTDPVRRTTRSAAVAADRARTAVDRSVNTVADLEETLTEEDLAAETAAEPLIRRASPSRQITRTAAAVEEQKLQELDALISGRSAQVARTASKVTSATLRKTETATDRLRTTKSAVQRAAKTHEDSALQEFDELTGRVAATDQTARSAVRRNVQRAVELTEDSDFSMELAEEGAEPMGDAQPVNYSEPMEDSEPVDDSEPLTDNEPMDDSELLEELDPAAGEESDVVLESRGDAALMDESDVLVDEELEAELQQPQRGPRVQPRARQTAASAADLRSKAPGDGFEWQSGSRTGAGSKTRAGSGAEQGGATAKSRGTRPATLTREVADPTGDLEQVEEWLSNPVSAPAPPKSQQRPIRRSSFSDPFVQADEADGSEPEDDSISGSAEEMQLDESFAPSSDLPELPEPPETGAGLTVPVDATEGGAPTAAAQSVFSRLSPVSWVILCVGTVCILALLFFPSRRKPVTDGTAVIPV